MDTAIKPQPMQASGHGGGWRAQPAVVVFLSGMAGRERWEKGGLASLGVAFCRGRPAKPRYKLSSRVPEVKHAPRPCTLAAPFRTSCAVNAKGDERTGDGGGGELQIHSVYVIRTCLYERSFQVCWKDA